MDVLVDKVGDFVADGSGQECGDGLGFSGWHRVELVGSRVRSGRELRESRNQDSYP